MHVALISVHAGVQMSDFKVGNSTATEMNNYPNLDVEEANIQEAIAQFYVFFGRMVQLRNDIELLALDDVTKNRILDQLGDIESELLILLCLVSVSVHVYAYLLHLWRNVCALCVYVF